MLIHSYSLERHCLPSVTQQKTWSTNITACTLSLASFCITYHTTQYQIQNHTAFPYKTRARMRGTGKYPMKYFHYFSTSLKMEHSGHFPSSMPQHSPLRRTSGSLWGFVWESNLRLFGGGIDLFSSQYRLQSIFVHTPTYSSRPARPLRSGRASAPFMFPP